MEERRRVRLAGTEIPFARPECPRASSDRRAARVLDAQFKRIVRVRMTYATEETCKVQ